MASQFSTTGQGNITFAFLENYMSCPRPYDLASPGIISTRVFVLAFVGFVLFPNTSQSLHPSAIHITRAIIEKKNFIPTLLGETLYGLDRIASTGYRKCHFPVSLLQVWFYSHVGPTACLFRDVHWSRYNIIERCVEKAMFKMRRYEDWVNFFEFISDSDFLSVARWFKPYRVILSSIDGPNIPIMGLTGSAYYIPSRVAHQFGVKQPPPTDDGSRPHVVNLANPRLRHCDQEKAIRHIKEVWDFIVPEEIEPEPIDEEEYDRNIKRLKTQHSTN